MTTEEDLEIVFDERALEQKVLELAAQISRDYAGKELLLVCILKGAAIFFTDLARGLTVPAMLRISLPSGYMEFTVRAR